MSVRGYLFCLVNLIFIIQSYTQPVFPEKGIVFNDGIIPRIDIKINKDSLQELLKSENLQKDYEYAADFFWRDGNNFDTIRNVGFRLRGNTSRIAAKKSFKVKFNHFGSKKFHGLSDLNLNGEHNDPSIIRSKLSWDIMTMAGVEAPRSNHIALYINDEYYGLYINIEHVDNDFLEARNKDPEGQLLKLYYGCDFVYKGNNPNSYDNSIYEPANNKENPNYDALIEFTQALNDVNNPAYRCNLENIFDVDDYLKRMALEILCGHWDNPIFNKNNGYLYYNPLHKKVQLLSYDIDNTYGIDWFGINWATRNIYSWAHPTAPRPIFNNLMKIPEYKTRFGYYIKQYTADFFNTTFLSSYIENIKSKILPYRLNDIYAGMDYGYTVSDFLNSYQTSTGAHVKFGLNEYIDLRTSSAISQLQNTNISPIIEHQQIQWNNKNCSLSFKATAASPLMVNGRFKLGNNSWQDVQLFDDGKYPDAMALDGQFTLMFDYSNKTEASIIITARDANGKSATWPVCGEYKVQLGYEEVPTLVINEWMADNSIIKDETGDYDDWIEIYNSGNNSVWLGDKYLTDKATSPDKWALPSVDLAPGQFLLLWADEDQTQGDNHTNFKLSKSGEFIGIFDSKENYFAPIDTFSFGATDSNVAYGRYPDGQGEIIQLNKPTPGVSNVFSSIYEQGRLNIQIFPNPASQNITIQNLEAGDIISLQNMEGIKIESPAIIAKTEVYKMEITSLTKGIYILNVKRNSTTHHFKVIVL